MRARTILTFLAVAAAAACSGATEAPTALSSSPALAVGGGGGDDLSLPPPPPIDTGGTDIDMEYDGAFFRVAGRYFANTQGTNAWIDFASSTTPSGDPIVIASPNARLQYDSRSGRTSGRGTLVMGDGNVFELREVSIVSGQFGSCDGAGEEVPTAVGRLGPLCGSATFTVAGSDEVGTITVRRRSTDVAVD